MADTKTEKKTALLLLPLQLTQNKNILRFITVSKHVAGIKYDITDLGDIELRKYYHNLPNQAKQGLYQLTNEGLFKMEGEIIKRHKQQKSGVQLRDFLLPAYGRKLQEQFEFFKPFAGLVKWYHQLPNTATGNMIIAPCTFSTYKPSLQFEVLKDGDALQLKTILNINGNPYSLDEFRRFKDRKSVV